MPEKQVDIVMRLSRPKCFANTASVNMPMFTGKRGGDHYATARKAIDPMGKIFKKKNLRKAPHKLKDSASTLVYSKEIAK